MVRVRAMVRVRDFVQVHGVIEEIFGKGILCKPV
jgi:hypothetical protein